MKIRSGFVSNSSSSSFVIRGWSKLTEEQRCAIEDYDLAVLSFSLKEGEKLLPIDGSGYDKTVLEGRTVESERFGFINDSCRHTFNYDKNKDIMNVFAHMDNFDMGEWLVHLKVDFERED